MLGLALNNFGPSQLAYNLINSANNLKCPKIGFYQNIVRPVVAPSFSLLNFAEVMNFRGTLVTTSAELTSDAIKLPAPYKIVWFVNFPEWTYHQTPAEAFIKLFRNPQVKVVTRCEDYAKIISNNYGIQVDNINYDLEKLL